MKKNAKINHFAQSDYTLNRKAEGIVYPFADQIVEITLEDYLRENPDKTAADFAELKAMSDADYYETDRGGYRQTWKNISFDRLTEKELETLRIPSAEQAVLESGADEAAYANRQSLAARALDKLTEIQRRRYLMYHVDGLTMREIADKEGVLHSKIQKSLEGAEKKIKKILVEG